MVDRCEVATQAREGGNSEWMVFKVVESLSPEGCTTPRSRYQRTQHLGPSQGGREIRIG